MVLLLILIEGDRGKFEVSRKSSPAMRTPNSSHSAAQAFKGTLIAMKKLGSNISEYLLCYSLNYMRVSMLFDVSDIFLPN